MSNHEDYFALPGINASSIKHGRESMLAMHHAMTTEGGDATNMRLGRMMHLAILEPAKLDEVPVIEANTWQTKAAREALAEANGHIMLCHEYDRVVKVRDAVRRNKLARSMVQVMTAEVTIQWDDDIYGKAKARADGINNTAILDVKTTRGKIDDDTLTRLSWNMGYHLQAGWYCEGAVKSGMIPSTPGFYMLFVQQDEPHDLRVVRMDTALVERGRKDAIKIARDYRACEACGVFPGVDSDQIGVLEAPHWVDVEEVNMEGLS